MRRISVLALLSVALLAPGAAAAAEKAPPPACSGHDILTEIQTSDPAGYARIRAAADAVPNTGALLWRIEGKGAPVSYLFGTIHSTDPRVTTLSPGVTTAFNAAKTVALEYVDPPPGSGEPTIQELVAAKGVYPAGHDLHDVLAPAEMAALAKELAAGGIPEAAAARLRPWFASLALALPVCEQQRVAGGLLPLDKQLEGAAIAQGKRAVGLETMELQINALMGLPEDVQVSLLKSTLGTLALRDDALEVLHRAYLRRDLATSLPFTKYIVARAGYDASSLDAVERALVVKRNYGMRDAALPLLQEGGAFIAVGALHLLGKEGLVALVRAAGYTVTPVE